MVKVNKPIIFIRKQVDTGKIPEDIFKHSMFVGFSDIKSVSGDKDTFLILATFVPVVKGVNVFKNSFSFYIDIVNIALLPKRAEIINGQIVGRRKRKSNNTLKNIKFDIREASDFEVITLEELSSDEGIKKDVIQDISINSPSIQNMTFCKFKGGLPNHDTVSLYVACSELLHNYYPSNRLIESAFSGDDPEKCLYNPEVPEVNNDCSFVQLRKKIPDICAPYVARIRFSKWAYNQFSQIFVNSIQKPKRDNKPMVLSVTPPVSGKFSWSLDGHFFNDKKCFIVDRIKKCDADFPFNELLFDRDNDGRTGHRDSHITQYIPQYIKKAILSNNDAEEKNNNQGEATPPVSLGGSADVAIETTQYEVEYEDDEMELSGLGGVSIGKLEKIYLKHSDKKTIKIISGYEFIDIVASTNGVEGNGVGKIDITRVTNSVEYDDIKTNGGYVPSLDGLQHFIDVVDELQSDYFTKWLRITTLRTFMDKKPLNVLLPVNDDTSPDFVFMKKRLYNEVKKLNVDNEGKFPYLRKFMVSEIQNASKQIIYLIDFEASGVEFENKSAMLLLHSKDYSQIDSKNIEEELWEYVEDRISWTTSFSSYKRVKINHVEPIIEAVRKKLTTIFE